MSNAQDGTKLAATMIAAMAPRLVEEINDGVTVTPENVQEAVKRALMQDQRSRSKRTWAAVMSGLTFLLLLPEVQAAMLGWLHGVLPAEIAPMITAAGSAALAEWSKRSDPRPKRF